MISTELKTQIQGAYSRFLESKSLKPRYGQRLMIAEVAKVLGDIDTDEENHRSGAPAVVAVEAGTGTGKTVTLRRMAEAFSNAGIPVLAHKHKASFMDEHMQILSPYSGTLVQSDMTLLSCLLLHL